MRLTAFIERDMEAILAEWETFARALPSGGSLNVAALRNHAKQILEAVCKDIAHEQTRDEQALKSKGLAVPLDARETAAQTHALLRARDGFDVNQMASEYRALRASSCDCGLTSVFQDIPICRKPFDSMRRSIRRCVNRSFSSVQKLTALAIYSSASSVTTCAIRSTQSS